MELLERYLSAVRSNLPSARADDITAEMRGELMERVESREAVLGRPLDRSETAALLRAFGRPIVVSTRYRDHQQLIGPDVYPFYLHGLRVVAVITLAVFLFSAVVPVLTGNEDFVRVFTRGAAKAWNALFTSFAIVTLLFTVMDRAGAPRAWFTDWDPEQLPPVDQRRKSSWELPFDFGATLALLLWMLGVIPVAADYTGNGLHVEPGAVWARLYWPILAVVVAHLVITLLDWLRPAWTMRRAVLGIAVALGELALISALLSRGPWAIVTATGSSTVAAAGADVGINVAIRIALTVALIVAGVKLPLWIYRLVMKRGAQ